jgi:hypothetical protein
MDRAEALGLRSQQPEAPEPELALRFLADELRADGSVISPHVVDEPDADPALGLLAAAGPRARAAPGEYAVLIEAIREGYLLHYGEPRLIRGHDGDLGLLTGDYLYALGLARLAALGDVASVRELSDLISLCAQLHAGDRGGTAAPLWLAAVTAVACGAGAAHEEGKAELREGRDSGEALWRSAARVAARHGLADPLRSAAEAIDFHPPKAPDLG